MYNVHCTKSPLNYPLKNLSVFGASPEKAYNVNVKKSNFTFKEKKLCTAFSPKVCTKII